MRVAVGQAFDLTRDEIWFLKALRAAGERGRIVSAPPSRAALARLVEVQYVTTIRRASGERCTSSLIAADRLLRMHRNR